MLVTIKKRDLNSKAVIHYTLAAEYGTSIFHLTYLSLVFRFLRSCYIKYGLRKVKEKCQSMFIHVNLSFDV